VNGNGAPSFTRNDGSRARVERRASIVRSGSLPKSHSPIIVQVSRWDRLKDMLGVMQGFATSHAASNGTYLALVGPDVRAVADDPEGAEVFAECMATWQTLPEAVRDRVILVLLPMDDVEENAAMVNAIQRRAAVVIQKSLHEGFGLTVTEAMWKGRPIVASGVGGIQDQIDHGVHGLLLGDPSDLAAFGRILDRLVADRVLARRLGRNAQRRCRTHFLAPRHLLQYVQLLSTLLGDPARTNGRSSN
jgi:trehalose synthase